MTPFILFLLVATPGLVFYLWQTWAGPKTKQTFTFPVQHGYELDSWVKVNGKFHRVTSVKGDTLNLRKPYFWERFWFWITGRA